MTFDKPLSSWISKTGCAAVSKGKQGTAEMQHKLRKWGAARKNVSASEKYITTEVFNPK